jgi:hypothetical protein
MALHAVTSVSLDDGPRIKTYCEGAELSETHFLDSEHMINKEDRLQHGMSQIKLISLNISA